MRYLSAAAITAIILVCAATIIGADSILNSAQPTPGHESKRHIRVSKPVLSQVELKNLLIIALAQAAKILSLRNHASSPSHTPSASNSLALTVPNADPFVSMPGSTSLLFAFNPQTLAFGNDDSLELSAPPVRSGLNTLGALDEIRNPTSNSQATPTPTPSSWSGWSTSFDATKPPTATPTLSAVPEPAPIGLILCGLLLSCITTFRHRSGAHIRDRQR